MKKLLKTPPSQSPMLNNLRIIENLQPSMRYDGEESFFVWQERAREKLRELLGIDKIRGCDDAFRIDYEKDLGEYTEIRFTIESEPGYSFPSVLRLPKKEGKIPLVVCLQGHSTGFHISLGKPFFHNDEETIKDGDRDFAVRIIKEGYAALAIEQRNFGECGGLERGGPDCYISSMTALLCGRTTIGERVWDISRAIDAAIRNFEALDDDMIMCMGNSGGGTATFYAACIDERIKLAMPSCAVCTYKASIAAMNHCSCNFIPHIAEYFDMGDLAGLIAPRKLVIVNGINDTIFPNDGVLETYGIVKKLYAAAGAADSCALVTGPEGHRFYADIGWAKVKSLIEF